jgi:hypothetical protein
MYYPVVLYGCAKSLYFYLDSADAAVPIFQTDPIR